MFVICSACCCHLFFVFVTPTSHLKILCGLFRFRVFVSLSLSMRINSQTTSYKRYRFLFGFVQHAARTQNAHVTQSPPDWRLESKYTFESNGLGN